MYSLCSSVICPNLNLLHAANSINLVLQQIRTNYNFIKSGFMSETERQDEKSSDRPADGRRRHCNVSWRDLKCKQNIS